MDLYFVLSREPLMGITVRSVYAGVTGIDCSDKEAVGSLSCEGMAAVKISELIVADFIGVQNPAAAAVSKIPFITSGAHKPPRYRFKMGGLAVIAVMRNSWSLSHPRDDSNIIQSKSFGSG